jgi:hypothetical protein
MTTPTPTPVVIETPYRGDVPLHLRYLRACMRDSIMRGEAPYASHHLYTAPGVLRDEIPEERDQGIQAGFAWRALAYKTIFYTDLGWSTGMELGRGAAENVGHLYDIRKLGFGWLVAQLGREAASHALRHWRESLGAP